MKKKDKKKGKIRIDLSGDGLAGYTITAETESGSVYTFGLTYHSVFCENSRIGTTRCTVGTSKKPWRIEQGESMAIMGSPNDHRSEITTPVKSFTVREDREAVRQMAIAASTESHRWYVRQAKIEQAKLKELKQSPKPRRKKMATKKKVSKKVVLKKTKKK